MIVAYQKEEIKGLRCAVKELEENNLSLQMETCRLRAEHLQQVGELQRDIKENYLTLQTVMRCLSDEHFRLVEELQRDQEKSSQAMQTEIGRLSDEHLRQIEELQRDLLTLREEQRNNPAKPEGIVPIPASSPAPAPATATTNISTMPCPQEENSEIPSQDNRTSTVEKNSYERAPKTIKPDTQTSQQRRRLHEENNPEMFLLSDSNGKFINMNRLFPKKKVIKLWCPTTTDALDLLDDKRLKDATHIIIHTGTNDLTSGKKDVGLDLSKAAKKAAMMAPSAKIIVSSLLPRLDKPPQLIQQINKDLQMLCSSVPQIHLVNHPDIKLEHMYDHIHLNNKGVRILAKALKDIALDRKRDSHHQKSYTAESSPSYHSSQQKHLIQESHASVSSAQCQDSHAATQTKTQESYATVAAKHTKPLDQQSQIRDMLALICSKLLH